MSTVPTRGPMGQKAEKAKRHPLREAARGMPCTLRLACCNHNPETTVLAHIRRFGWAGVAQKPHDLLAVFACSACHDRFDRRVIHGELSPWRDTDTLRALGETLMLQLKNGHIKVLD